MDIAQLDEMLHGAGNVGHHAQLLYLIELAAVELKVQDLEKKNGSRRMRLENVMPFKTTTPRTLKGSYST